MYKKGLENYKDLIKIFILLIVYLLLDKINKLKLNNYWIIIATSTVFLRINAWHLFLNLKASLGVFFEAGTCISPCCHNNIHNLYKIKIVKITNFLG